MRAATWSIIRDIAAARVSWQRARQVADRLPADDPDRTSMRDRAAHLAVWDRVLLCGTAWRVSGSVADTGFDELRDLAAAAGDEVLYLLNISAIGIVKLSEVGAVADHISLMRHI